MNALDDVMMIEFRGMSGNLHHKSDQRCSRDNEKCRDCDNPTTEWHVPGYYLCTPCAATWCALTMIQRPEYTITKRK